MCYNSKYTGNVLRTLIHNEYFNVKIKVENRWNVP